MKERPIMKNFMQQYHDAKAAHPNMMVLFRNGDFYELFEADAELAHRDIGLTLTKRDKTFPMAGFPHHKLEHYLRLLLGAGHRVAVCEQIDEVAKPIVATPAGKVSDVEEVRTSLPTIVLCDISEERDYRKESVIGLACDEPIPKRKRKKFYTTKAECRHCGKCSEVFTEHGSKKARGKAAVAELFRGCTLDRMVAHFQAELPEYVRVAVESVDGHRTEAWMIDGKIVTIHGEPSRRCTVLIETKDKDISTTKWLSKYIDTFVRQGFSANKVKYANLTAKQWERC